MSAGTRLMTVVMGWIPRQPTADTAQGQRLEALEAQLRMFEEIALDYSLATLDAQGSVLTWNRGAQQVEGHAPEQIIGRPWDVLFAAEDREQGVPQQLLAAARRDGRTAVEGWRLCADGGTSGASARSTTCRIRGLRGLRGMVAPTALR